MSLRQERINKALVQQISEIIRRMKDPRLGFVTVTQARITPDLHLARVGVSVLRAGARLVSVLDRPPVDSLERSPPGPCLSSSSFSMRAQ